MADLRDVATAWEAWQTDAKLTGPAIDAIDFRDEAGHRERAAPAARAEVRDGIADGTKYAAKRIGSFDDDIVYANGTYIRFPEGL